MEWHRRAHRALGLLLASLVILGISCSPIRPVPLVTSTAPATPTTPVVQTTPTNDATSGLTVDAAATLLSIEQVDDYPFYVMHYVGGYDYSSVSFQIPAGTGFGCSLFAALGGEGDKLYGRNFDWEFSPALMLFTDPPDGYASLGMVNLFFLRVDWKAAAVLDKVPLEARAGLLAAPPMTMDGMNEYGLVIGMALVTDGSIDDTTYDMTKPTIGPLGVIRQMLDHARNVDEAVKIFMHYNIDFNGALPIHYLLADPSGKAVLLEYHADKLYRLPNLYPWHLATNHLRCIATGDGNCWRYTTLQNRLVGRKGALDPAAAMQLLSDVQQPSTQWSVVYNMDTGDVNVVVGADYATVHTFHLDLVTQ